MHTSGLLQTVRSAEKLHGRDPIICGSRFEVDELRRFFDTENLYEIELESYVQMYLFAPVTDELAYPPNSFATSCALIYSFVDNADWNDYVYMESQFDLFKHPIRGLMLHKSMNYRKAIEGKHGCCSNRRHTSKEISIFLVRHEPKPSDQIGFLYEFLSEFIIIGLCIALICLAIEFSIHSIREIILKFKR